MSLTIFDLDNTLIAGDSDHLWGEFLLEKDLVDSDQFQSSNDAFYRDYCAGKLDIHAYLRFALEPLTKFSLQELNALHQEFMQQKIEPLFLPKAHALIDEHRRLGQTLLIITATNRFVTEPIAKALEIDNLLASEAEVVGDRYTGNSFDTPCYAEGKVTRLNRWLKETGCTMENSYFYSDSHNDIPLLSEVSHPIAVDPDPTLEAAAEANNWKIISLR